MTMVERITGFAGHSAGYRALSLVRRAVVDIAVEAERWAQRHEQRRALLRLNDSHLKDVGLSRADVEQEFGKPFWRQ